MSLDVYLTMPEVNHPGKNPSIFIREYGQTKEISLDEWRERFPDREPVYAVVESNSVFEANITHNLGTMADEAGIYEYLWHPKSKGVTKAHQLIKPLMIGLALMKREPERFKALNPENGWGSYDVFVPWIEQYILACCEFLDADVDTWV